METEDSSSNTAIDGAAVVLDRPPGPPFFGVVPTAEEARSAPVKGRLPWQLRRGIEKTRVRGYETKRQLIELHVMQGHSLKECARLMGRNYQAIHRVWRLVVEGCSGERVAPEEHLRAVRAYADQHLRATIETAQSLVGDAAAYGAVVIAGVKQLCELHGVKPEEAGITGTATLEDIGKSVRVTSPLLLAKLDRVLAAKEAKERGASGGGNSGSEGA